MRHAILCLPIALFAGSASGCSVLNGTQVIPYDVDPQELDQNISQAFTATGTFPSVDCTASASVCTGMTMPQGVPPSATITCDASTTAGATAGAKVCTIHYTLTQHITLDLSKLSTFPSAVASSPVIDLVTLDTVKYWGGSDNKVNVDTPPLGIYVGSQTAMSPTDSGVQQLGTIPAIPANSEPDATSDCSSGPATSSSNACQLQLTSAGQSLFQTLAKDFQTPFNIILSADLTISGGTAFPQGTLDLFVSPEIDFHL
jgi:hypothetical protein